jgi:hypothetical protein
MVGPGLEAVVGTQLYGVGLGEVNAYQVLESEIPTRGPLPLRL